MWCKQLGWHRLRRLAGRLGSRPGIIGWRGLCRFVLLGLCIGSRRILSRLSSLLRTGFQSRRGWLLGPRGWGCSRWLLVGGLRKTIRGVLVGARRLAGRILSVALPWRMWGLVFLFNVSRALLTLSLNGQIIVRI